jgi:hypothetical protein
LAGVQRVSGPDRYDTMSVMAKKKQSKKHHFKYTEPTVAATLQMGGGRASHVGVKGPTTELKAHSEASARLTLATRDFSYVTVDVRRSAVLAVSLVALEVVLWYAFAHTGLGNMVYSSFNV